MRSIALVALGVLFVLGPLLVQGEQPDPANDALFEQLKDPDMNVRIAALRELQTTLDPRLPEALLILLKDEGTSTRRLAARGIGSRYWQIPKERVPVYLKALREEMAGDRETTGGMVSRAIALLTRDYKSPEMSRSANGRWVLYERYSRPCLIDTENGTEELFGWKPNDYIDFYNQGVRKDDVDPWHPEKEIVVMTIGLARRITTAWAWIHKQGLVQVDHDKVIVALGYDPKFKMEASGFFLEHVGWEGTNVRVDCDFLAVANPEQVVKGADAKYDEVRGIVLWNPLTGEVRKAP